VGLLHEEASDSSRMDNDKSNRRGEERKGNEPGIAMIASSRSQWVLRPRSTRG